MTRVERPPRLPSPFRGERPLSRVSRYTARFHVPAATLEGVVVGVFTLNDIILRKTFGAGTVLVTLAVMASPASQLLAIVWGNLMEGREKRRFILFFGGLGRLVLLFVALATAPLLFAAPVILSITLATAIIPALNALYQSNYASVERGRVYGWVVAATSLATMLAAMGAGAWMDVDPRSYRLIYPIAGVLGAGSAYLYYRIRQRRLAVIERLERRARAAGVAVGPDARARAGDWLGDVQRALRNPLRGSISTFRADPLFRDFEVAYMVYGMAFMIMQPVIPIFLVDQIHVQYAQAALARGPIFFGVTALLSPLFGLLLDRWNAVRISIAGFAVLVLFPLGMAASHSVRDVYLAFAVYGVGMAAVNIAWTMGPILFAGRRDAATYMGVHVTMVGIRGLIGNPLGLLLLQTVGSRATFAVASGLFLAATALMLRLDRRVALAR